MRKLITAMVALVFCAPFVWAGSPAKPDQKQVAPASPAAAQMRQEYFLGDTSRVVEDAKPLLKKYPSDLELHAWYVIAKGYGDELPGIVDQMKKGAPDSPWTLLASAATAGYQGEFDTKLDLCEKAIAGAKGNPDVLVLATGIVKQAALIESFSQKPPNANALKAFLSKYKGEFKRSSEGLAAEAQALDTVATIEKNTKSTAALKLADQTLKGDPTNVSALLLKSQILLKQKSYQANYDLLKTAAQAVPESYALHQAYWRGVLALPNANAAAQSQEIEADATRIISAVKPSTSIVQMSLSQLHTTSPALATPVGDLYLKQYPQSNVEDAVLYARAMANEAITEDDRDAQVVSLEGFIDRSKHYDTDLLGMANWMLVNDMTQQEHPDLDRLYKAELATKDSSMGLPAAGIVKLADRKSHLPEIEALAESQLDAQWGKLQGNLKNTPESQLKTSVQSFIQYTAGSWLDALGWVELKEGKLDAALPDLEAASKFSPQNPQMAVHLGHAYQAKRENAKAEKTFLDAFAMPYYGEGDHPAIAALRELYVHTHGSSTGLEAYMQPILARDAARRHKAILGERLSPESPLKSFELASLNRTQVGSNGLKGKYLILKFWATW